MYLLCVYFYGVSSHPLQGIVLQIVLINDEDT